MIQRLQENKFFVSALIILVIAAIVYLPKISEFGYFNDDWYLMYAAHVAGPEIFHEAYEIDRPMRGYVMEAAFSLFGIAPLPYHISAFIFRVLSGIGLLWSFSLLWPRQSTPNMIAAVLFTIYPGFLEQPNPIDYQSQIISLACGMFSIALTLKSILVENKIWKWLLAVLSILLGWVTLGLVEYFFGFEVLRFASIAILILRKNESKLFARALSFFRTSLAFLLIPIGFLTWRLFFFTSERRATDIASQIGVLSETPLVTLGYWFLTLLQDAVQVVFLAWGIPLANRAFSFRLSEAVFALILAGSAALALGIGLWLLRKAESSSYIKTGEMLVLGLFAVFGGLLPVILVNRSVDFVSYSRYALSGATGAVLILTALLMSLRTVRMQVIVSLALVAVATLTHFGNAIRFSQQTETLRNFWWQVAWRAPSIEEGTLLMASYPGVSIQEDYFVWGPANLVYYPEPQTDGKVFTPLSAVTLASDNRVKLLVGAETEFLNRRGNRSFQNFQTPLVLTQPGTHACVRILDGDQPELSMSDDERLFLVSGTSNLNNVIISEDFSRPPEIIFGPEPQRGWCYYYQRASLLRQMNDWQGVLEQEKLARKNGFSPQNDVEWMPFLQAHAMLDNQDDVMRIGRIVKRDLFLKYQACNNGKIWDLSPEMRQLWENFMCLYEEN
jgi:hypothetical protein